MIAAEMPYPIGAKFNRLTVLERAENDRFGRTQWRCKCDCGNERVIALFRMKSGHTRSCGCAKTGAVTHGKSRTPTHNSWNAMRARCNNPKNPQYKYYGARGIKVCEAWDLSFSSFLKDMGERPEGMTLDRIDCNGNYEPGNCKWSAEAEQARNRRSTIKIERNGVIKCVKDWCEELGISTDRVYKRLRNGYSPEEALK